MKKSKNLKMLILKKFKINKAKKSISGILFEPQKTLLSASFFSTEYPEIKGFVWEAFQMDSDRGILTPPSGFNLKEGDWFGTITFTKGFDKIISKKLKKFTLIESLPGKPIGRIGKSTKLGQVFEKFRAINRPHELSSTKIEVRPGSTHGSGRNEHGKPHFHLINKKNRKEIAKIEIPDVTIWKNSNDPKNLLIVNVNGTLTKVQKRELLSYFQKDNFINLVRLKSEWDRLNKDNNRVF